MTERAESSGCILSSHSESEAGDPFRAGAKVHAIVVLDMDGRVSSWNASTERIEGYLAGEIIGQHFASFHPPEVLPLEKSRIELEIAVREGRFEEEGWRLRKDGSRFWANATTIALRDPAGQLVGFVKVTQDLTLRRAAEEEARRFRALVESVKDYAIFILDPTGHVSTWNRGAERIKGYASEEIIGKHFSIFYPLEEVQEGKCEFELAVAREEGHFEEEGWRLRKDGSRFWASVTITSVRDSAEVFLGFAKVTRDLTQRREAEANNRALAEQRAALAEKSRIHEFQERFLAILGHDLRNPLASIRTRIGILRELTSEPATARVLGRMAVSARRMKRMIEQILDLTRTRLAGGLELDVQPMALRDTLTKIIDELRTAHPDRVIDLGAPPVNVLADPDRMEQVFSNLISNAILHGDPSKPVVVRAGIEDDAAHVTIHNQGDPIPEGIQHKLFDPFRRGERESRTAKTAGLGLGLYISWEIVRGHGGRIEVESNAGRGTTFRVSVPFQRAAET